MKNLRLVLCAVVIAALAVLSFRTTSSSATVTAQVPCDTTALGQGFEGQFHLSSIQNYGCEGEWAFVWATVGTGVHAIGVTEVLAFKTVTQRWSIVSRAVDCKASILPNVVYRQGCFSN
jgi:hypothetical protein